MSDQAAGMMRTARAEDAERCGEIAVLAWQRVHDAMRQMLGDELADLYGSGWEERKRNDVMGFITRTPERAIVTEMDGQVVGFLTFSAGSREGIGEIGNNAVHPGWQGHGIGARQCQRVLEIFREMGLKAATVYTGLDEGHAPARAMYVKAGFTHSTPHIRYFMKL
jgi:GNAT superfamily N-acetyltransferase